VVKERLPEDRPAGVSQEIPAGHLCLTCVWTYSDRPSDQSRHWRRISAPGAPDSRHHPNPAWPRNGPAQPAI